MSDSKPVSTLSDAASRSTLASGDVVDHADHNTTRTDRKGRIDDINDTLADLESQTAISGGAPTDKPEGKIVADIAFDPVRWRGYGDGSATQYYLANDIYLRSYLAGCGVSNGTDATNDIDFAAGVFMGDAQNQLFRSTSTLVKQIDANWASGTAAGGFPSGLTLTNDTWYHLFMLGNPSSGAVDAGFDSAVAATNLLSDATGFTEYRRVGSILYGTATITAFVQTGDVFLLDVLVREFTETPASTSRITKTITAPLGIVTQALISAQFKDTSITGSSRAVVTPLSITDTAPGSTLYNLEILDDSGVTGLSVRYDNVHMTIETDTSSQISYRVTATTDRVMTIFTKGWIDTRGRDA